MNFDYIYATDVLVPTFYKLPKILFTHKDFKKLSTECKVLYSLLLDRTSLSMANKWCDGEKRVYVCFTVEEAIDLLGKSRSTVLRSFSTLDSGTGVGLIHRKKRGQGKADLIYVKKILLTQEEEQEKQSTHRQKECVSAQKLSTIQEKITVDNQCQNENIDFLESTSETSSGVNFDFQGVSNSAPIKTDSTNTQKNETDLLDSLPPSNPPTEKNPPQPTQSVGIGESERVNSKEIEATVWVELNEAYAGGQESLESLVYKYRENRHKMKAMVDYLVGIHDFEEQFGDYEPYSQEKLILSTRHLYSECLTQLLLSKKIMTLKGQGVTYFHVLEKMLPHIGFDESCTDSICLGTVVSCTTVDFLNANKEYQIKNPVAYMKACIWSTLQEGTVKSEMNFQYMFG